MTHLHLVEPSAPPKPPRATRRVRDLLADVVRQGEARRFVECVVVTLEKDGVVGINSTNADPTRLLGILEVAKHDILEDTIPVDAG